MRARHWGCLILLSALPIVCGADDAQPYFNNAPIFLPGYAVKTLRITERYDLDTLPMRLLRSPVLFPVNYGQPIKITGHGWWFGDEVRGLRYVPFEARADVIVLREGSVTVRKP
jgi:hypothetical protein